jgi:hypothetical protein
MSRLLRRRGSRLQALVEDADQPFYRAEIPLVLLALAQVSDNPEERRAAGARTWRGRLVVEEIGDTDAQGSTQALKGSQVRLCSRLLDEYQARERDTRLLRERFPRERGVVAKGLHTLGDDLDELSAGSAWLHSASHGGSLPT